MSAINKINDLIEKLESGDADFIKEFQNNFIIFEKEYDKGNFFSNTFDYYTTSNEILINSKDNNLQSINQNKYLEELINKNYFSLAEQNYIQEIDDIDLVLAA
ncbi:MAG: hypothetical protein Q4D67_02900 [Streptococcus minor]|nr:hypothetical protein [Streptococcus minor]